MKVGDKSKLHQFSEVVESDIISAIPGKPKGLSDYLYYNRPRLRADALFLASRLEAGDSVLDVGAVPPYLSGVLAKMGHERLTIADPAASDFSRFLEEYGIEWEDVNLLDGVPDALKGQFDLVTFNEVLEHLAGNLYTALEAVTSCLKPGGRLMLTTPNLRSLSGLYALVVCRSGLASKPFETVRYQYDRSSGSDGYFGHVREYTGQEVVDMMEGLGFRHVTSEYQSNYTTVPEGFRDRFAPRWKRYRKYWAIRKGYRFAAEMERFVPTWRLFGKHLFEKAD